MKHIAQDRRRYVAVSTRSGSADHVAFGLHVAPGLDPAAVVKCADTDLVRYATDPGELGRIELRTLGSAEQWLNDDAAGEGGKHRAVLGRQTVKIIHGLEAARARHILHHERRIARDIATHVTRQRPGVDIVAATSTKADQHLDRLA